MSIENITVANTSGSTASSLTFSHNHTAGNYLVVFVGTRNTTNISVTYNGVSMTSETSEVSSTAIKKECFVLEDPAGGANDVVVTLSTARRFSVFAVSLSNIGAVRNTQTASSYISSLDPYEIEMDVPSGVGDIVLTSYHWERSNAGVLSVSTNETLENEDDVNAQASRGALTSKAGLATETPTKIEFNAGGDNFPGNVAGVGISLSTTSGVDQHSFRFRNDDGSESAATWKENLNTNTEMVAGESARIRILLDTDGSPGAAPYQFEARTNGGSWLKVEVE